MDPVEIRSLRPEERAAAVGVLARGMRDNPGHIAAFGADPQRRLAALQRMFTGLLTVVSNQQRLCAVQGHAIVGVAIISAVGGCQPHLLDKIRIAVRLASLGIPTLARVVSWQNTWSRRDPSRPHRHFGPLAVDAHAQGQGIGSLLMQHYLQLLDDERLPGYLETDKPQNVTFYARHGFDVTGETIVLGRQNWFMHRLPTQQPG